jgi:hypothetical protein
MAKGMAEGLVKRQQVLTRYASDGLYAKQAKKFTKAFQGYDRALIVKWLFDKERWSVWTRDRRGMAYLVFVVETPDGQFRKPGQLDLVRLAEMDLYRKKKSYSLLKEVDDSNNALEEKVKEQRRKDIEDLVHERWRWMKGNPQIYVGPNWRTA